MDELLDCLRACKRRSIQTAFVCGLVFVVNVITICILLFKKG